MKSITKQSGVKKKQDQRTNNLKDHAYYRLIKRFPLRPIRSEEESDRAAEICDELTDQLKHLSVAEQDYLEVLSDLIIKYESRWLDKEQSMNPCQLIIYLMEQNDLNQSDLVNEFGSRSRVSEFLSGKRKLSLEQAKKLSNRFKLKLTALIED